MKSLLAVVALTGTVLFAQAPQLIVSPTTITAAYTVGAQNPPPFVDVTILSSGVQVGFGASLVFTGTPGWAFLATPSIGTPGKVTVNFSPQSVPGGLQIGTYTASLNIDAPQASPTQIKIPITLNVVATSQISASPTVLTLAASTGTTPTTGNITVNSSGSPFAFQATATTTTGTAGWLNVSPASGTSGGQLTVTANPTGLAAGNYTGKVTITAAGIANSPLDIPVNFTVSAPVQISASPAALNFNFQTGTTQPAAQTLSILTQGLQYTASITYQSATSGWLTVSPLNGSSTANPNLTVSVNTAGLTNGVYNAKITLSAPGTAGALEVPVTLTVSNLPLLNVSPGGLVFNSQQGSVPPTQALSITSTSTPLNYTVGTSNAPWLVLSQPGGTSGTVPLLVVANSAGLAVGTYTGNVVITAPGAGNPQVTVPVILTVSAVVTLSVAPTNLVFTAQAGGAFTASQPLTVTSSDSSQQTFTVKTTTTDGASWLLVDRSEGTTATTGSPATTVNVLVNQSGLAPGNYTGSITVAIKGSTLSQTIPVALTVTGSGTFTASPERLTFLQPAGGQPPASQQVQISSNVSGQTFIATTNSSGNWLNVSPSNGTTTVGTPNVLTVSINPNSLAAGTYTGSISVIVPNSSTSLSIPVTLTVGTVANLTAAPSTLTFSYALGGQAPAAQTVKVTSSGGALPITATVATTPAGGTWLSISPTSGSTPLDVAVAVNPAGLTAGTYTGNIVFSGQGALNGPQTVTVTLTIQATPAPSVIQMVNGASFLPSPAVPGLIVTFQGTGLGPANGVSFTPNGQGIVESTLSGTRVLFDGVFAAPILYTSATQVNAIVPYDVFGRISTSVQLEYNGQKSNTLQLRVDQFAPAIFASGGQGQGAILNQNFTINANNNPADRGSIIQIFATGEGYTTPAPVNGKIIASDLRKPLQAITARVGGQPAEVLYYGSAPGLVSGAMQVNVRVPTTVNPGNQSVEIIIGGVSSIPGVTVALR